MAILGLGSPWGASPSFVADLCSQVRFHLPWDAQPGLLSSAMPGRSLGAQTHPGGSALGVRGHLLLPQIPDRRRQQQGLGSAAAWRESQAGKNPPKCTLQRGNFAGFLAEKGLGQMSSIPLLLALILRVQSDLRLNSKLFCFICFYCCQKGKKKKSG